MALLATACASHRETPRPIPTTIDKCPEVFRKIRERDQFYSALRGRASLETAKGSADLELALAVPGFARVEVVGPLGVRVGLLSLNEEWLYFFLPREKIAYRFPSKELYKNTLRRDAFFENVPIPVLPEIFFAAALTRVNLPKADRGLDCRYDPQKIAYVVRIPDVDPQGDGESMPVHATGGGRLVWVAPESFAPDLALHFDRRFPTLESVFDPKIFSALRAADEIRYSKPQGAGYATLQSEVEVWQGQTRLFRMKWKEAEAWPDVKAETFEWRPAASITVKDF